MVKLTYPEYQKFNIPVNHFLVVITIYQTKLVLKSGKTITILMVIIIQLFFDIPNDMTKNLLYNHSYAQLTRPIHK